MIKQATLYKFTHSGLTAKALEHAVEDCMFQPCVPTQQKAIGFVSPRGEDHGALVESIDGQYLLKVQTEVRKVPAQILQRRTDELAAEMEKSTGRKPGKKTMKELKEQALLELLPMAFTSQSAMLVWLDRKAGLVVFDGAGSKVDDAVSLLIKVVDGLALGLVQTEMSPAVAMAHWLGTGEAPYQFTIDRECELKSTDEMKSIVKYGRHPLDIDEVRAHIVSGKVPTKLALTWRDRISLVLTDGMQLKKISFLDVVFEGDNAGNQRADEFDANTAIFTGEMSELLPDLFGALGGEQVMGMTP